MEVKEAKARESVRENKQKFSARIAQVKETGSLLLMHKIKDIQKDDDGKTLVSCTVSYLQHLTQTLN